MRCKNAPNKNYTGKENTPLGRGYSASGEPPGKEMRGKDGKKYRVKKIKNGKRWEKVSQPRKGKRVKSPRMDMSEEDEEIEATINVMNVYPSDELRRNFNFYQLNINLPLYVNDLFERQRPLTYEQKKELVKDILKRSKKGFSFLQKQRYYEIAEMVSGDPTYADPVKGIINIFEMGYVPSVGLAPDVNYDSDEGLF